MSAVTVIFVVAESAFPYVGFVCLFMREGGGVGQKEREGSLSSF